MSCQEITPREEFQRRLEAMNPEAAAAIKRMVEAEQLLKKRRGPLHPSTDEEIRQAAEVSPAEGRVQSPRNAEKRKTTKSLRRPAIILGVS